MNIEHVAGFFCARTKSTVLTLAVALLASGFTAGGDSTASAALVRTAAAPAPAAANLRAAFSLEAWAKSEIRGIDTTVLRLALTASRCAAASGAVKDPRTLTIIDYSKASVEPRLWVLDLRSRALLYEELVSHGQGSGGNLATKFSNTPDSHQTSIGLYVTDQPYVGRNGYSLRLDGLDRGFNDRARERAIVIHGASYVNPSISKSLGRLGRSHGCPAVRTEVARELIDRVKGGDLVFAYYPDAEWLSSSQFLGNCGN
jgi:hypothetical protein